MSNIYDKASDMLDRYGWIQNSHGRPDIGFCALGALTAAVVEETYGSLDTLNYPLSTSSPRVMEKAQKAASLPERIVRQEGHTSIIAFNDHYAKDADEVKFLFKKASEEFELHNW